jgi:hypothetical protein
LGGTVDAGQSIDIRPGVALPASPAQTVSTTDLRATLTSVNALDAHPRIGFILATRFGRIVEACNGNSCHRRGGCQVNQ